jgi:trehalose 6-phosphate phosphatase
MDASTTLEDPPQLKALCKSSPVALFLDFDGTLVGLAERPDAIRVPPGLGKRLCSLADRLGGRLAIVSGRSLADMERHLGKLAIASAGSHGIARRLADGSTLGVEPDSLPSEVTEALRGFADEHGFSLEEKAHGAALHFRAAPHLEARGREFAEKLAAIYGLAAKRGKCVIELVRQGVDKGGAVRAFMNLAPFHEGLPVFLGDDVTDEDGFAAARDLGGFGILVGDRRPTAARYRLPDDVAAREWLGL